MDRHGLGDEAPVWIDRQAAEVTITAAENLPRWAHGLGIRERGWPVVRRDVIRPGRRRLAERNAFGVLDHDVALPSGEVIHNPMRVVPDGGGCEVMFHLRRMADMSDADFARDAGLVQAALARLKHVLEGSG